MALRITYYPATGLFRSEGDAPNGVVGISAMGDEHRFVVSPTVDPPAPIKGTVTVNVFQVDPLDEGGTALTAEEVVEACSDDRTVAALWQSVVACVETSVALNMRAFLPEKPEAACALAREVRDQLAVNGYLSRGGGGE